MSIIVTVVTSRRDVKLTTISSYQLMSNNQTRVCFDTYCYTVFNFAWGMLKTGVSILPPDFCLIEGLEAY